MTGSAYQAMDVLGTCDSLYRVGVWGRDYIAILVGSRLADDGKRTQCDGRFSFRAIAYVKGRGLGKGKQSGRSLIRGWRMTGSAYNAMDVLVIVRKPI